VQETLYFNGSVLTLICVGTMMEHYKAIAATLDTEKEGSK